MQKCQKKKCLNELEKHLKDALIHHIHVKFGKDVYTISHKGSFITGEQLSQVIISLLSNKE